MRGDNVRVLFHVNPVKVTLSYSFLLVSFNHVYLKNMRIPSANTKATSDKEYPTVYMIRICPKYCCRYNT